MRFVRVLLVVLATSLSLFAQSAGKVDRLIPQGYIARGTATNEAKPADPVQWLDILRTNDAGRMRIGLDDGSVLSLGAHSELRVVKHDPASDQTTIEMLYGKARANVVPIKKNGGSFQIRTPTAVIGVVGTTLDIETVQASATVTKDQLAQLPISRQNISDLANLVPGTMPNGDPAQEQPTIADYLTVDTTIVRSLEHIVGVKNIDPKFPKIVFLLPGQYTIVKRGQPPTDPQFGEPSECPSGGGHCECTGPDCSNPSSFYDNAQPDKDAKTQQRPQLTQNGVRSPTICSFETLTLGLDTAKSKTGQPDVSRLIDYEIVGRGTSTGNVFDVHVKNLSGCPLNVQIPAGVVLKPTGYVGRAIKGLLLNESLPPLKDFQDMIAEGGFGEDGPSAMFQDIRVQNFFVPPATNDIDFTLRGYCLDLHKLAPHQKTKYKFADADDQQRLGQNLKIVETANKLFFTGKAQPTNASLDSLVQWSLWAAREGLNDEKHFTEQYVGLVERNYQAQKKKFDKNTKQQVEDVAHGFWPYVQTVLQAAK